MRRILALVVLVTLALGVAATAQIRFGRSPGQRAAARQPSAPQTANAPATAATGPAVTATGPAVTATGPSLADAERTSDEQTIREVVELVGKYYNAGKAQALARLFTADAEMVDEAGHRVHGQQAIEQAFAAVFAANPQSAMTIHVESIRFLSPTVAIEEGHSTVKHQPGDPAIPSRYSVVHVLHEGKWQMALARDLENSESEAAAELEQLGWLVGSWLDESPEALVRTNYRWSESRQYLFGQFTVQIHGRQVMTGTERIGWDPVAQQLRSWIFDSEGGFAEGLWTRQGSEWMVKSSGSTRDGRVNSATNVYRRLGSDRYAYRSRDRVMAGRLGEDIETIAVREPPRPAK
ncbi:MAG TPA: SgcJ/EcaC family oxidoreductase [Pirellulales bacterium]